MCQQEGNKRDKIIQITSTILLMVIFVGVHIYFKQNGLLENERYMLFAVMSLSFIAITYSYVMLSITLKRHQKLLTDKVWQQMPLIVIGFLTITFLVFVFLFNSAWLQESTKMSLFLFMFVFSHVTLFMLVLSLVYYLVRKKEMAIHYAYYLAIKTLIVMVLIPSIM